MAKRKYEPEAVRTEPEHGDARPAYTMQALVRLTGIAPDTLRAWERRYNFPQPARTPGGHRLYSLREVDAVRWVMKKQEAGLRVRQAIDLWKYEQPHSPAAGPATAPVASADGAVALLSEAWVQSCLTLDDASATQTFNRASAMLGPENALLDVVTTGLSYVGERWAAGTASVAQEHFASALAMRHVQSLLSGESPATRPETLLISCPDGEYHVYPSIVLMYLLRRRGWPVIFMNASLPLNDLLRTVERERPELVLMSSQTVLSTGALLTGAEALRAADVLLAFGGSVFVRYPGLIARIPGAYLGAQLAKACDTVQRILSGQVEMSAPALREREWLALSRDLPDALLHLQSEVLGAVDTLDMLREDAEAELGLICGYLLNVVRLGAREMLPGVWRWSETMLRARGLSPSVQQRFHAQVRLSMQTAWANHAHGLLSLVMDSA